MAKRHKDSVEAYLERLPEGLDSYPDHVCKASVLRAFLTGYDLERLAENLPPSLAPLADPKTAVTAWLSEVHLNVVLLAQRELFFDDDEGFVADAYRRNRELLAGPLYRMLTKFFSVQRISAMGRTVFHHMHRGVELHLTPGATFSWSLRYPPHLIPPLIARCYATAATAALELGGTSVTTQIVSFDAECFEMEIVPRES